MVKTNSLYIRYGGVSIGLNSTKRICIDTVGDSKKFYFHIIIVHV